MLKRFTYKTAPYGGPMSNDHSYPVESGVFPEVSSSVGILLREVISESTVIYRIVFPFIETVARYKEELSKEEYLFVICPNLNRHLTSCIQTWPRKDSDLFAVKAFRWCDPGTSFTIALSHSTNKGEMEWLHLLDRISDQTSLNELTTLLELAGISIVFASKHREEQCEDVIDIIVMDD